VIKIPEQIYEESPALMQLLIRRRFGGIRDGELVNPKDL
jgi:hypothetical protein